MQPQLEDYEAEEQFVLEFVPVKHAIEINESADHLEKDEIITFRGMIERENRVLKILQEEFF